MSDFIPDDSVVPPAIPEQKPTVAPSATDNYYALFSAAEQKYGLPDGLLKNIAAAESGNNPAAVSRNGARGLMQFMPETAVRYGVNPDDPASSINGAGRYLRDLTVMFGGDLEKAVAAYNAGEGAVQKHSGVPPYKETRTYVGKVLDTIIPTAAAETTSPPAKKADLVTPEMRQIFHDALAHPDFKAMPSDQQEAARIQLFRDYVAPTVPISKLVEARKSFDAYTAELTGSTTAGDVLKSFASGAINAVGETFHGAGDLLAKGINAAGEAVGRNPELRAIDPLKSLEDAINESKTPAGKRTAQAFKITGDTLDPSTWKVEGLTPGGALQFAVQTFGQYAPQVLLALVTGGTSTATQAVSGAVVGGLQGYGGGATQERDFVMNASPEELAQKSTFYKSLIDQGVPQNAAREATAKKAELGGGLGNGIPSALEGAVEQLILKAKIPVGFGKGVTKAATGAVMGAVGQGVEEDVEQRAQNLGSNVAIGGIRPIGQDTLVNAVGGFVGGAGFGAATSMAPGQRRTPQVTPLGPLTRAANVAAANGIVPPISPETGVGIPEMGTNVPNLGVAEKRTPPALPAPRVIVTPEGVVATDAPRGPESTPGDSAGVQAEEARPPADLASTRPQAVAPPSQPSLFGDILVPTAAVDTDVSIPPNPIDQAVPIVQKNALSTESGQSENVDKAAHEAATSPKNDLPEPTEAQKEAGNYPKGHITLHGLDIAIENPAGSRRRPEWPPLAHHYGYIKGTEGKDKDHIDVFIGPKAEGASAPVFVVDQVNKDRQFDEHKVMLGFESEQAARDGYLANYTPGWTGLGAIKQFTLPEFKLWLKAGNTKKPVAYKRNAATTNELPISNKLADATPESKARSDSALTDKELDAKINAFTAAKVDAEAALNKSGLRKDQRDNLQSKLDQRSAILADALTEKERRTKSEERTTAPVAESQAPAPSEPGEGEVATAPAGGAPSPVAEATKPDTTADSIKEAAEALKEAATAIKEAAASVRQPEAKSATEPTGKIEDFGEEIEGARKHYAEEYRNKMRDALTADVATEPLSKSWPEPEYRKLLDASADPWVVAFVHAARDEIPPKPRQSWKIKGWVENVQALRGFANSLLDGGISKERVQSALDDKQFARLRDALTGRTDLYQAIGHDNSLKGIRISHGSYSVFQGVEHKPAKIIWSVEKKAASTAFSNWPTMLAYGDTREEAIANFKKAVEAGSLEKTAPADRQVSFDIYSYRRGEKVGKYYVGKKIGKEYVDLESFDSAKAAREYLANNRDKLIEKLEHIKYIPNERKETNAPRVGVDHRNGANVTPKQFGETFGFRGVQFGNWVEGAKRQQDLNEAYDALMDLAGVLDVPPKALSLNGELGLAFGARGTGAAGVGRNAKPPKAHYEPGHVVINLTKEKGAGSLAHEWWHGLDNYFSRMRNDNLGYLTEKASQSGEGVRPEMVEAFRRVMQTVNETGLRERSNRIDKTRTKPYWSTGREMTARAFESYVIEKLRDQGASNDYLANIVSEDYWNAAASLGIEKEGTYPYPEAAEISAVRAAFDKFFQTVETKETDKGTVLFSRTGAVSGRSRLTALWTLLATHDEAFQQPTSTRKEMRAIAADIDPSIKVEDVSWSEKARSVRHKWEIVMPDGRKAFVTERTDGRIVLNAARLKAGVSRGNALYNIASTYAHNNGRIFIGDPLGLSEDALYRRLENMISSSLRFGTTDHLQPHPDQANKLKIQWKNGNFDWNLEQMLQASYNSVIKFVPEIKDVVYNFESNHFEKAGQPFTDADFDRLSASTRQVGRGRGAGGDAESGASAGSVSVDRIGPNALHGNQADRGGGYTPPLGRATLKRAAVTNTLVQGAGKEVQGRGEVLAGALRQLREGVADTPLAKILYSKTEARPQGGLSASRVREILARPLSRLSDTIPVEIVQSVEGMPFDAPADTRGVYYAGKVWLVAGNLTKADARRVLTHEVVGHIGLEEMLGNEAFKKFVNDIHLMKLAGNKDIEKAAFRVFETHGKAQALSEDGLWVAYLGGHELGKFATKERALDEARQKESKEILAYLAENGIQNSLLRRIVAQIRLWLARMGLGNLETAEIEKLIAQAARFADGKAVEPAAEAVLAFSKASPTFYSQLARVIESAKQAAMPAKQWALWLKANAAKLGVKQDEIEAVGLNEWLDLRQGSVTKDAVLDFVRQNGVQVREIIHKDSSASGKPLNEQERAEFERLDRLDSRGQLPESERQRFQELSRREWEAIDESAEEYQRSTKFSQYQLPGGENYRELLLKLPTKKDPEAKARRIVGEERWSRMHESMRRELIESQTNPATSGAFRSPHFDEPNVLAHVRFNERTDAEGKRVLFIEEVQSDWAQKGRKEGFSDKPATAPAGWAQTNDARSTGAGIPSAPFVTKTESWAMLAMKRMIRYAAENGFDRIAWTTGEQQASRYDLSNQIDYITYSEDGVLRAFKDKMAVITRNATEAELPDIIGKEAAEKLLKQPIEDGYRDLRGDGLKVGGEGMRAFYDQMLPQWVNKYVKKWGGKIGETKLKLAAPDFEEVSGRRDPGAVVHSFDITPAMRESVMQGQPMFSRAGPHLIGDNGRAYTDKQREAFRQVGREVEVPTLKERVQALWKDAGKNLAQGLADQFAPVKDISQEAYRLLRLSKGASGAFQVFLNGGKLKLTDNVYDFDDTQRGGVIERLLIPLQGESDDFLWWVAANRAEQLTAEDREHLFSRDDIAAVKTLEQGTTGFDYTIQHGTNAGQVTRDRTLIYRDALQTFNEFNKNALDMAEQSGLIDGDSRRFWEKEFYVPFYRVDEEEGLRGMNIKSGVVRQQAFKHLKGGRQKLSADLLGNTLLNWAHLLDAAAKNRAAKTTLEAAERIGAARKAEYGEKHTVWFMDRGRKAEYKVDDPHLLTAISALEYAGMRGPLMSAMGQFKHFLTIGVTASPFFKIRNLIRDSVQSIGVSPLSYNAVSNIAKGYALTHPESDSYFRLLAGGGTIHFGTMLEGSESKRVRALVEAGVDESTILDNEGKLHAFYKRIIEPAITAYNEIGNRGEAINRAALYDQLVRRGVSHAEASLLARDLMDFSMQGAWTGIRFLSQTVPFFNARLQGLYKLGRSAKEDSRKLGAVLGATALFSIALMLAYEDDDDWKKREDWDRDNYWWFKIGGAAFRIPKPFEIGAMASLAERGVELFASDEMTGERFRSRLYHLLADNLSFNPVPQLVKPVLDIYANTDSFTGRPIETLGMERLQPDYRMTSRTSMAARSLSTAGNVATGGHFLSPVQVDHLIHGYFGWLGSFVVGTADMVARPVTGQVPGARRDYWKVATGGIVADKNSASSRYVTQMYEQSREIEQAYGTWRSLLKEGKAEEAREFREENIDSLKKYGLSQVIKRQESKLNERIRMIERSNLSPEEKRRQIDQLRDQKDRIARRMSAH